MDYIEIVCCPGHPRHPRIRGVDEPESQNFNKIEDFLDGDPPLLLEFNCFVLYRTFYRLYQQEDGRQDVSREIFPGCRQELFQYYF